MAKRISKDDWSQIEPRLRSFSRNTTEIAYAVLVDGRRQIEVAEEYGLSTQAVHQSIKRVKKVFDEYVGEKGQKLVFVEGWLPPELAEKVMKMIAESGKPVEN